MFRMASQMLGRVMQQAEPESCTQASRGTESSTLFPTPPLSSKNPRRESTSESGEAAQQQPFLRTTSSGSSQQQPFLRTPSSGSSFSRTSSGSSASTTSKPILRVPSSGSSISRTSSSASTSSKSSVSHGTFSRAASSLQWEGLPRAGHGTSLSVPSKRWVAGSTQPEGSHSSKQPKAPNSKPTLKHTGQGKRSKHDAAKFSAMSNNAKSIKFDQDLEQLIRDSTSIAIHGSTKVVNRGP